MKFDPRPFARAGAFDILVVSGMHTVQFVCTMFWSSAVGATCIKGLSDSLGLLGLPGDRLTVVVVVSGAVVLALIGDLCRIGRVRLLLLVPQNLVLMVMAGGGVHAAYAGRYLDGTLIPSPHIANDQIAYLALFIVHSRATWARCMDSTG